MKNTILAVVFATFALAADPPKKGTVKTSGDDPVLLKESTDRLMAQLSERGGIGALQVANPPAKEESPKPAVKLSDGEKAQLYKALAAAANAQAAAMQAEAAAKGKVDELNALRSKLETKCGSQLTEENGLVDCSSPKK